MDRDVHTPPRDEQPAYAGDEDVIVFPASFGQQRLWFIDQLDEGEAIYNISFAQRIRGPLDTTALEQSLNTIVRRHEVLRTTFTFLDGGPIQVIAPELHIPLSVTNLESLSPSQREGRARQLATEEANRPFDLAQGPLLRTTLLHLAPEDHVLVLTMHHIISDEWSMNVLFRELRTLYEAFSRDESFSLPALPIQYADYAVWQREWLQGERLEHELEYWREQLEDLSPLELPTDHPRPAIQTFRGAAHSFRLPAAVRERAEILARAEQSTLFMILLAALKGLLYRYTGQPDVAVGAPIAGRTQNELSDLIGFFVNTLVLRTDVGGAPTFRELLHRVRATALEAYAHQSLPFEKLVEALKPDRAQGRTPLFQVMFTLQRASEHPFELPGLRTEPFRLEFATAKFDLTVSMRETEAGLMGTFRYSTELFDRETIERMAEHFCMLLEAALSTPDRPLSALPLLTEAERHQLLVEWNDTTTPYPDDRCVHELFEAQVERDPNITAVVSEDESLTYRQLNQRANQLAHRLKQRGVAANTPVGLLTERSVEGIVGMLAVLKAGGVYVPLDPSYPANRLQFMRRDAQIEVLLTNRPPPEEISTIEGLHIFPLDTKEGTHKRDVEQNLSGTVTARDPAYVIYTSGSTGRPKGVVVPHDAIARLVKNTDYIQLTSSDAVAHASNISFDAATFEIWGALLNGARIVIFNRDVVLSPKRFAAALQKQQISTLFLTTALFNTMARDVPQAFASVKHLLFGGEAVTPQWVRTVLQEGAPERLLHVYGPTESTTFTTWHRVEDVTEEASTVPIGRPIANTTVYVLDQHRQPVPIGVPGELYIGGDGLALGYLNRPELTAEKFVDDPFNPGSQARLYKTGDRVRWRADGSIEFIGRTDHQVKLRGFRIELKEIEAVLSRHPSVDACIVQIWKSESDDRRLIGYVVPNKTHELSTGELLDHLKKHLPPYMVPARIERLATLPLTPNGKVDRQSLPAPKWEHGSQKRAVPPRNSVETRLAKIWRAVLNRDSISVRDNFFDLGGHSLLAVELFAEIERAFNKNLPISTLFTAPTIEALASVLQEDANTPSSALVPLQSKGARPPLFCTHGHSSDVLLYAPLVDHIGSDQPVYGLQGEGLDGKRISYTSVEEMAATYTDEICTVQREGPYLLMGFCYGGLVALEVAQQLLARGKEVALLVLVDSVSPLHRGQLQKPSRVEHYIDHLDKVRDEGLSYLWNRITLHTRYRFKQGKRRIFRWIAQLCLALDRPIPQKMRHLYSNDTNYKTINAYTPNSYPGSITLFRSSSNPHPRYDLGWGDVAESGAEVYPIEGSHHLLQQPYVDLLAARLRSCIDAAIGVPSDRSFPKEPETSV